MKHLIIKFINKIKGLFNKNKNRTEELIKRYEKVDLNSLDTIENKLNYSLKNYSKDFYTYQDFSEFGLKLWELSESSERPLLVMIMGEFKTGKSTFINAILGKEVLKSDVTPATAVVTMISYGEKEKLVAHFHDGESKEYPLEMLNQITAEGDESKQALRSSIKYVELQLPLKLLEKITLIDTPGLNVDNELHIKATKHFMYEADMVLWIFSYGKTASRTELASISELGERLKPIAIVNRIDEIDEEEESLEDVLAEIRKRLKSSVKDVYGVSSYLANKAIQNQNQQLLIESGWATFSTMFNTEIVDHSIELKKTSLETRVEEFIKELKEYIQNLKKDLDFQHNKYNDKDNFEKEIKQTISLLKLGMNKMSDTIQDDTYIKSEEIKKILTSNNVNFTKSQYYLNRLKEVREILSKITDSQRILESIEMYEQLSTDTEIQLKNLELEFVKHQKKVELHNVELQQWEKAAEDYNKSGLLGGRPLFDWHGTAKRLEERRLDINSNASHLNYLEGNLLNKLDSIVSRIVRQNKEIHKFISKLMKMIEKDITKCESELTTLNNDFKENMKILNKRFKELEYVISFIEFSHGEILTNSTRDKEIQSA
jgi:GTPase Era involved in 16S rRNA processing